MKMHVDFTATLVFIAAYEVGVYTHRLDIDICLIATKTHTNSTIQNKKHERYAPKVIK